MSAIIPTAGLEAKNMGANAGYRLAILPLTSAIGAIAADVGLLLTMSAVAASFDDTRYCRCYR
jgi:hypothetical protein